MDFSGKVVLITGASSGIGAACATQFAKLSAKLALVGRNVEKLKNVADNCEQTSGIKPLIIIADISLEEDTVRIVQETINKFEKLDVVVNNAGILLLGGIMDDIKKFDRLVATNIRGPYLITQQALPHLIESKGNIVNVSSILSTTVIPAMMAYSMTKAAFDMLTKCVALDVAPEGVRVNSVNPGPVYTELFRRAGFTENVNTDFYAHMTSTSPLKKVAHSEDVANMIVFLASENASCITGSRHEIDCGIHLGTPVFMEH